MIVIILLQLDNHRLKRSISISLGKAVKVITIQYLLMIVFSLLRVNILYKMNVRTMQ